MYIKLKERTYWVEDDGKGIPLLMFHGFTGSGRTFTKINQLFTSSIRTICIDLPGHGKTGSIGEITMEQFASDLTEILDELNLSSVQVLGYSMGGGRHYLWLCFIPNMCPS
ncbi:alpha/beta fold hydrolase [Halobacillus shinanisalinarum]|uniref:Alpha/beta fold hydrolase n=1 Tax=Halobacillus shinanisalinarum TaxID=2932258 RepID=A0ABY4H2Q9_9BACI|nr:alpha/beta fold hydrolase [Halobacillus shinanisalinarum]UOQ94205.1 alpha/beta fold hydrolase [Halobacillus shinanisalinarum]